MIRNILNRIFSTEASQPSTTEPVNTTNNTSPQPVGISAIRDSFESVASKNLSGFELGVMPPPQNSDDATKNQEQLLQEKQKLSDEQKKFDEMTDNSSTDRGTIFDYQTQTAVETFTEPEKSAENIADNLASPSEDPWKH